ncbi:Eftud2 protein [Culex quinquefasciatus]|uniref:Eftud2 protein n=1 Tax=Culex quinquefasciatus TaxID=7176 RepID=B0X0Y5_CULQU|nr:Eftud2 protein [Culex quinquefasciatus]|eukprot:XP_001863307.1 Eftud2 protein [Culex quinquefasciatus]
MTNSSSQCPDANNDRAVAVTALRMPSNERTIWYVRLMILILDDGPLGNKRSAGTISLPSTEFYRSGAGESWTDMATLVRRTRTWVSGTCGTRTRCLRSRSGALVLRGRRGDDRGGVVLFKDAAESGTLHAGQEVRVLGENYSLLDEADSSLLLAEDIENESACIVGNKNKLGEFFQVSYNWDLIAAQSTWAFGPDNSSPNKVLLGTFPVEHARRPLYEKSHSKRRVPNPGPIHRPGTVPPRRWPNHPNLTPSRLQEPYLFIEVQDPADCVSFVYTVLVRQRGHVTQDAPVPGSPLYTIKDFIRVAGEGSTARSTSPKETSFASSHSAIESFLKKTEHPLKLLPPKPIRLLPARLQQHQPEPDLKAESVWGEFKVMGGARQRRIEQGLHELVKVIPEDTQDGSFYRASLAVHQGVYELAQRTRDLLNMELTAMVVRRCADVLGQRLSAAHLMCRERTSITLALASEDTADPPISKLYETKARINSIIDREQQKLNNQIVVDRMDCPENIFVQQALDKLKERRDKPNRSRNRQSQLHGGLDKGPLRFIGKIVRKDRCSVSEDLRKRLKYLKYHICTQVAVVQVELEPGTISTEVLVQFKILSTSPRWPFLDTASSTNAFEGTPSQFRLDLGCRRLRGAERKCKLPQEPLNRGGGQFIPITRRIAYSAFVMATPRLMEPYLFVEVQAVLARRRGPVTQDALVFGSPLYTIKAFIPKFHSVVLVRPVVAETVALNAENDND